MECYPGKIITITLMLGENFNQKSVVWFHLYKIVENENYNDRKQSSDCLIRGKRMAGNKY